MSLPDWLDIGWLRVHEPTAKEIQNLLKLADKKLNESLKLLSDNDLRFNVIYSAVINLADAALMADGYRTRAGAHHYYTILSLEYTIKLESRTVQTLDSFRIKRHVATYEESGVVSKHEADEILRIARDLQKRIINWMKSDHPDLMKKPKDQ